MSLVEFIRRAPGARAALAGPIALRRGLIQRWRQPVHEMLDRFGELVTGDVQIRVTEFDGEFVLPPRSHLLHRVLYFGEYEPALARLFASKIVADRDVIDVGANVGFFSVLAAKKLGTGRVLAVEPTSTAHARLVRNLALNDVAAQAIVFNGLVSNVEGVERVNIVPGREEFSSMGDIAHPAVVGEQSMVEEIVCKPLDQLVREHDLRPALIKVDVEGSETLVFEGAEETLKQHRPVVISEFTPALLERNGSSPERVLRVFERCGYDVHDAHDMARGPQVTGEGGDIIAIPR